MQESTQQALLDAGKAAPPVTVVSSWISGLQPERLLVWATLIYTVLLILHHCWKNFIAPWVAEKRQKRARRRRRKEFNIPFADDEEGA